MSRWADARDRAEAGMNAWCRIVAASGEATYDWDLHRRVESPPVVVHSDLPCSVVRDTRTTSDAQADRQIPSDSWVVSVSPSATGIRRGHAVIVTQVDPDEGDPEIVGVPLTVDMVDMRTRMVRRMLRCVDTRPDEARLP